MVGALNDTTDLPNSGDSDTESLDAPSTSPADRDEENEQDIQNLQPVQHMPNSILYDEDLLQNHVMFLSILHRHRGLSDNNMQAEYIMAQRSKTYTKVHRGGGGAGDSPRGRLRSGAPEGVQLC